MPESAPARRTNLCQRTITESSARLIAGQEAWKRIRARFDEMGVRAELFGSMARGTPHGRSDLDILVTECAGLDEIRLLQEAEEAAGYFPVDVVCANHIPMETLDRMRKEAVEGPRMVPGSATSISNFFGTQNDYLARIADEVEAIASTRNRAEEFLAAVMRPRGGVCGLTESDARTLLSNSLSGSIQSAYAGIERIIRNVLEALDNFVPSGDAWHRQLLNQAASKKPYRPPLLTQKTLELLDEMCGFRHFAENARVVDVEDARIAELSEICAKAFSRFKSDMTTLEKALLAEARKNQDGQALGQKRRSP